MSTAAWLIVALVVVVLVGPFLTLRAVAKMRARKDGKGPPGARP